MSKELFKNFFEINVHGEEEKEPFSELPSEEKKQQEKETREYKKQGQEMIDSYRAVFARFAQDISLRFKMSDAFKIDLENGEVHNAAKWYKEKDFSKIQILWANLHELSHFRDWKENPEKMKENFDYIFKLAKKTGAIMMKKWEEKYGASDPEFIEKLKKQIPISKKNKTQTLNKVEQAAYKIHHTFYNIFDDIYVNNLISRKIPMFEEGGEGASEVKRLYKEKLFAEFDYSNLPRHLQFDYYPIRKQMVPDEEVILSDELSEIMNKKIKFQGKEYTPVEIVENFLKPKKNRDTKAGERYFILKTVLEPVFTELLMKDLDEWEPEKPKQQEKKTKDKDKEGENEEQGEGGEEEEGEESSVNPFQDDYDEYDENNPDKFGDEEIDDWHKKYSKDKQDEEAREAKEKADEEKGAGEKAEETQNALDNAWCARHKVDYKTLTEFRAIEKEIAPYLEELSKLWRKIVYGGGKEIKIDLQGHFKEGEEIDILKTIEEYPRIEKGDLDKVEIMKKQVRVEIPVKKPELIRVRLSGDMSGSMNEEKLKILRQCFVLIISSIEEFNKYLNFTRAKTKSKLKADTEGWIFGNTAEKIKFFKSEAGAEKEQEQKIKIVEKMKTAVGNTFDHLPLEKIAESIPNHEKNKILNKKIMEIVFEITDGGSSNANKSREAIEKLLSLGIIVRAFQIGKVNKMEREIFNYVWNMETGASGELVLRKEPLGEVVGEDIKNLLPSMTKALIKFLKSVRL